MCTPPVLAHFCLCYVLWGVMRRARERGADTGSGGCGRCGSVGVVGGRVGEGSP